MKKSAKFSFKYYKIENGRRKSITTIENSTYYQAEKLKKELEEQEHCIILMEPK